MRQPKKVIISKSVTPQVGYNLSGVVLVHNAGKIGTCYIKFNVDTLLYLGKIMPFGISKIYPAYLRVYVSIKNVQTFCCYLDNSRRLLVWEHDSMPPWIWRIKYD